MISLYGFSKSQKKDSVQAFFSKFELLRRKGYFEFCQETKFVGSAKITQDLLIEMRLLQSGSGFLVLRLRFGSIGCVVINNNFFKIKIMGLVLI